MVRRQLKYPDRSLFLFGARGTGKSTWARQEFPQATHFDFLDADLLHRIQAQPGFFAQTIRALPRGSRIVLDEVQRLPEILHEVHRAIESHRHRFVLLGSSTRRLKDVGVNLLAGRASERHLYPFLSTELGSEFRLEQALETGTVPLVWEDPQPAEALRAYVATYIRQEIERDARLRDLGSFSRFLVIAGLMHGQVINYTGIGDMVGAERRRVESYFQLLEELLMAWRLPAFEGKLRVRERQHPKFFWIDAGLARAAKGQWGKVSPEERGHLLEGWVANTLRVNYAYRDEEVKLAYWAAHGSDVEVDLIASRGGRHIAFEVKSAERRRSSDSRGLRAVAELPGLAGRYLVQPTPMPGQSEGGVNIISPEMLGEMAAAGELTP